MAAHDALAHPYLRVVGLMFASFTICHQHLVR